MGQETELPSQICEFSEHIQVFEAETLKDVVDVAQQLPVCARRLWRGQALQWPLHSKAYRRWVTSKTNEIVRATGKDPQRVMESIGLDETIIGTHEENLLMAARRAGHHYMGGRRLNDIELLARLQHHGASTRLLDVTSSLFVALWFACDGHFEEPGIVFGINCRTHATQIARRDGSILEHLDGLDSPPLFVAPPEVSPRIAAQQGGFIVSAVADKPWGSLDAFEGAIIGIEVGPALKQQMEDQWESLFGFRIDQMFPDIDGFGRHHGPDQPIGLY